jgi:hypothetical protein
MKIGDNPTSINPATQLHIEKSGLHTVVLDNGNVGIGTVSPESQLHIKSLTRPSLTFETTGTTAKGRVFQADGNVAGRIDIGSNIYSNGLYQRDDITQGSSLLTLLGGTFHFRQAAAGSNPVTLSSSLYIDTAGNVGIGTVSPAQKLSVVGTIESTSGGFKFPDGTTQTTARGSGVAIGSFSSPGSTGNYSVTGLSFRPRLVRLSLNNTRSGSLGAYATSVCYGAMTSSSQYAIEWYVSVLSRNFHFTDRVIHCSDADATDPKVRAAYVSMNSDGFTINFTTATTGWTVLYEALE